jgi:putative transcriptional regulator
MTTKREYRSTALGAIHETMAALENIGAISKITMREFDAACLQPVQELKPEAIRALREREHLSQAGLVSTSP